MKELVILSKNIQLIVDIEANGNIHRFTNEYLNEERSDKLRAWIKGTKAPNLNEIDKFVQSLKNSTGRHISLDWLVYDIGEMFISK